MSEIAVLALVTTLCGLVGALMLILVNRVFKQGDENSRLLNKVDENQQHMAIELTELATIVTGPGGLAARVQRDHDRRNAEQVEELRAANAEIERLRGAARTVHKEGGG